MRNWSGKLSAHNDDDELTTMKASERNVRRGFIIHIINFHILAAITAQIRCLLVHYHRHTLLHATTSRSSMDGRGKIPPDLTCRSNSRLITLNFSEAIQFHVRDFQLIYWTRFIHDFLTFSLHSISCARPFCCMLMTMSESWKRRRYSKLRVDDSLRLCFLPIPYITLMIEIYCARISFCLAPIFLHRMRCRVEARGSRKRSWWGFASTSNMCVRERFSGARSYSKVDSSRNTFACCWGSAHLPACSHRLYFIALFDSTSPVNSTKALFLSQENKAITIFFKWLRKTRITTMTYTSNVSL